MKRKHILLAEKLAAALYELQFYRKMAGVPHLYETMYSLRGRREGAKKVLALFDWDHVEFHSHKGEDRWWNLTPLSRAEHKEKTKRDIGIIAKGKRIQKMQAAHLSFMEKADVKQDGMESDWGPPSLASIGFSGGLMSFAPLGKREPRPKRKIQSRPFQKRWR